MIFTETSLKGSYIIDLSPLTDERGWFARTYCKKEFEQIGYTKEWLQLNHSFTKNKRTIRGMHFQLPPHAEIKLVRCIAGVVMDIIVDIRKGSSTFLKWTAIELSAINRKMIYIPEGFAHGFQTLTDDCELIYHHSEFYMPGVEAGIKYNEPKLNIKWPLDLSHISGRDNNFSYLTNDFKGI
ncbi:MAG: dTDP-4-dehydrorhamnose 3,5-epimerase [Bacteroidia bacterium]|nr:dTDP-4-dehydrorhamnose 3,5-epimerase [Bacteroidia bacterium]